MSCEVHTRLYSRPKNKMVFGVRGNCLELCGEVGSNPSSWRPPDIEKSFPSWSYTKDSFLRNAGNSAEADSLDIHQVKRLCLARRLFWPFCSGNPIHHDQPGNGHYRVYPFRQHINFTAMIQIRWRESNLSILGTHPLTPGLIYKPIPTPSATASMTEPAATGHIGGAVQLN